VSKKAAAISFVKASACGNDFLLVDFPRAERALPDIAALTRRICDRHDGVGADGVEWMRSHPTADVEIRLINADGSEAEISGNGTRCVAAYLFSGRGAEKISIQTGAGLKTCVMTGQGQSEYEYEFEIEMGSAVVEAELSVKLGASEVRGIPVSMGNPHYVVFVQEFVEHWQDEAADIQRAPGFKQGVNVEHRRLRLWQPVERNRRFGCMLRVERRQYAKRAIQFFFAVRHAWCAVASFLWIDRPCFWNLDSQFDFGLSSTFQDNLLTECLRLQFRASSRLPSGRAIPSVLWRPPAT
jgi:diaminopimelate epimerase